MTIFLDNDADHRRVVSERSQFDSNSGSALERLLFNHRGIIMLVCGLLTVLCAFQASKLQVNAGFEDIIPQSHPYIRNYLENKTDLRGLGNNLRVVVENTQGDIYDPEYLEALRQVNDKLFLMPGVNRSFVKSIWMPVVRWTEVTEEGFRGGPVMPDTYDGSARAISDLRLNVSRAGLRANLVANDQRSAMIVAPLLERYADTGKAIDYRQLYHQLETLRSMQDTAVPDKPGKIRVHIVGFGKLAGDLISGLYQVMLYFAIAALVTIVILFFYTRCVRSTVLVVACSLVAVVWQLGMVRALGYSLDPYSILVPFLVFAIGISHGAQKMNGIMQDIASGTHKYVAARFTFRRLFLAGLTALVADAVGFAVLMIIDIPVIKSLALTASIGVAVLVFTNLILLPILLSCVGVGAAAARRSHEAVQNPPGAWNVLVRFTEPAWAISAIGVAVILSVLGFVLSLQLQIGDLDAGAPELRPDARYNQDAAFITDHYRLSSDQFAVMVKTPPGGCEAWQTQMEIDRLEWALQQVPGVQSTVSLAGAVSRLSSALFEASPKWITISHNQALVNTSVLRAQEANPDLVNSDCSMVPVIAYLADHKAQTLNRVLLAVEAFAREHDSDRALFLPAAGSAGIEAVTNIVVRDANRTMLVFVYLAVAVLCFITFRSWRAVVVALVPLIVTSILCEALMVALGIGVKVATLPVIALGVGIGVDYALYLLSVQLAQQRNGVPLAQAYRHALLFTGKVVALVGVTLAAGVITWAWSPIKFQADMGILLTFMFVWNMLGALILIPALSCFLLRSASR
ncbi:putative RND superfamily exporter protein [Pseudomonas lini]|uniref:efflux RND transporter permease subunit n=1 Tax=Pseudomonas lini TaxID=163011 RepID=UPI0027859A51|nr:MMPL family transporter [Pseudomonas lini]MDQ0124839.1 putative RND superfamily exporter protein [Pseudomonas lini]